MVYQHLFGVFCSQGEVISNFRNKMLECDKSCVYITLSLCSSLYCSTKTDANSGIHDLGGGGGGGGGGIRYYVRDSVVQWLTHSPLGSDVTGKLVVIFSCPAVYTA